MPLAQGVSLEWIEQKEDEIARMITAAEQVDELRIVARLLLERGFVTQAHYNRLRAALDGIATALQMGKHNTSTLRNSAGR